MNLLTLMLTLTVLKPLQNQGQPCGGEGIDAGPMWIHHGKNRGVGTPDRSAVFRPPTPFFTPRVRLPHFGNVSPLNSFPTNLRNIKPFCSGRHSHPFMIDKNLSQSKKENNESQPIT